MRFDTEDGISISTNYIMNS